MCAATANAYLHDDVQTFSLNDHDAQTSTSAIATSPDAYLNDAISHFSVTSQPSDNNLAPARTSPVDGAISTLEMAKESIAQPGSLVSPAGQYISEQQIPLSVICLYGKGSLRPI